MPSYVLLSFLAAIGFALAGVVNKYTSKHAIKERWSLSKFRPEFLEHHTGKVYLIRTIGVILIPFSTLKISLGG